ncbi:MAG TPA: hypothetical protein VK866_09625 [Acidimicrobiales bacterium]|nr:hypothetical protein [Acidimicrobiales bacterium]
MKKGRHRRFEEARALKRSQDIDFDDLFDSLKSERTDEPDEPHDEHPEWDDIADGDEDPERD